MEKYIRPKNLKIYSDRNKGLGLTYLGAGAFGATISLAKIVPAPGPLLYLAPVLSGIALTSGAYYLNNHLSQNKGNLFTDDLAKNLAFSTGLGVSYASMGILGSAIATRIATNMPQIRLTSTFLITAVFSGLLFGATKLIKSPTEKAKEKKLEI